MDEELFDIYDADMNPLGTATRAETHAKGYWHRSFHCWLTYRDGDRQLVRFQVRAPGKDTNPGCCDITVAGHLTAGETMHDAVRELEEEIGVSASFDQLIPLGQVREEGSGILNGQLLIDKEVSDVFALVCDIPLAQLRLQPEEVVGVYEAGIDDLLALFEDESGELVVYGVEPASVKDSLSFSGSRLASGTRVIRADQFVPRDNSYYTDVLLKLRQCT